MPAPQSTCTAVQCAPRFPGNLLVAGHHRVQPMNVNRPRITSEEATSHALVVMTAFPCEQRVRIARHRHDGLGNAFGLGANGGRGPGGSCRLAAALGAGGRGGLIPDGYRKPGVSTGGRPKGAPIETEPPGSQGLAWLADHR